MRAAGRVSLTAAHAGAQLEVGPVVFSWIGFKSRKHSDRVNAKARKDPRLAGMGSKMPFDPRRMAYGGFEVLIEG